MNDKTNYSIFDDIHVDENDYSGRDYAFQTKLLIGSVIVFLFGMAFSISVGNESPLYNIGLMFSIIATTVFVPVFIITFINLIKSLYLIIINNNDVVKTNKGLYNLSLTLLPIIFFIIPIIYHNTGPRGAVNNCFSNDMPSFVSCQYKDGLYSCHRNGKAAIVSCNDGKCNALCER